jgi:radical SAM superfamily enzyme YgiQ (UPF0313 family)
MRILLIAPLFEHPNYPLYLPSENLGIGYLAGTLRNHGLDVTILDCNMLELDSRALPDHAVGDYRLVGISIPFQSAATEALRLASVARSCWPQAHITVGGHFPTFRHAEILRASDDIDSVVREDGEDTLLALCTSLDRAEDLSTIDGLTFRDSTGATVVNPPRRPREDLDSLPWPARDTLADIAAAGHPWATQLSSSRGCYASCAFCDIRSFYGRTWRARTPSALVDEIQFLHEHYGSVRFRFTDDEYIGPRPGKGLHGPTRAKAIAREIMSRHLPVELMIDARPEAVERDLFLELRDGGVVDCLVGVESGVDRILKLYNKGASVKHNIAAIDTLRELGISLNLGFIMFDPRMTIEELKQNFAFLRQQEIVSVDSLRSWLWPLFGTPVVEQLRSQGLLRRETLGDIEYVFADPQVEAVFEIVMACSRSSFEFERSLFTARKRLAPQSELEPILSARLKLWLEIFEGALAAPSIFDFAFAERRFGELNNDLSPAPELVAAAHA